MWVSTVPLTEILINRIFTFNCSTKIFYALGFGKPLVRVANVDSYWTTRPQTWNVNIRLSISEPGNNMVAGSSCWPLAITFFTHQHFFPIETETKNALGTSLKSPENRTHDGTWDLRGMMGLNLAIRADCLLGMSADNTHSEKATRY